MSSRILIFVESNTSGTGRRFVAAAAEMGFRPWLLASEPSRYDYVLDGLASVHRVDTSEPDALLDACQFLGREGKIAGVLSSSDYYVSSAASLAARLGLPGPDPSAMSRCRDKEEQRAHLLEADVPVPKFCATDSVHGAVAVASSIGLPVVLKPVTGSGSFGVMLCRTPEEVAAGARDLLGRKTNERGLQIPGRILVEELVRGREFSIETFGYEVVGVTKKHLTPPPSFVEMGHDFPAPLPRRVEEDINAVALRALRALGLGWGPAHTEIRLSPCGPKVIEVNPRLAGGHIPELVRLSFGIDLISATLNIASGERPSLKPTLGMHSSIRFLLPGGEGRLVHVEGMEEAASTPAVTEVKLYRQAGSRVRLRGDFRDRIGHVIACGARSSDACDAAESAHRAIRLTVEPESF